MEMREELQGRGKTWYESKRQQNKKPPFFFPFRFRKNQDCSLLDLTVGRFNRTFYNRSLLT